MSIKSLPLASSPIRSPIGDDYSILRTVLGTGVNGEVVLCTSKPDNTKFALKVLRESDKAKREVDLQWRASSVCDRIVKVVDVYENVLGPDICYLMVMECMEGGELFDRIKKKAVNGFSERDAAQIMHQVCIPVRSLHEHDIAHRDIKPENLLYTNMSDDAVLKLGDFGFAAEASMLATPCFTPYFASPETLARGQLYDKSCDMWSLGVLMYILLCGYPPFRSRVRGVSLSDEMKADIRAGRFDFPDKDWSEVSENAKTIIRSLIKPNPDERLTIQQLMSDPWIAQNNSVPATPLASARIIAESSDQWPLIYEAVTKGLMEIRVDHEKYLIDTHTPVKLDISKNDLHKSRQQKLDHRDTK